MPALRQRKPRLERVRALPERWRKNAAETVAKVRNDAACDAVHRIVLASAESLEAALADPQGSGNTEAGR